ncbi:hypothetical protein VT84_09230 [Gemmata sp. SH-PL17]|uniref:hypothetical protein n=1 Tax=Gemmata sp. SH-PL17 TaxID=1630693 RepID=UPI00078CF9C5|nr:hypothetical protein [Gemmata sp. SH-PL17]AMV24565.1 hypothetical protein VT84_09230 [Gemmata sp. SH-PL17]
MSSVAYLRLCDPHAGNLPFCNPGIAPGDANMGTGKRVAWDEDDDRDNKPDNRRVTKGGTTLSLFDGAEDDTEPTYEIKCPKRPTGYAAQVWADDGYWELRGLFSCNAAARVAAQSAAANGLLVGKSCEGAVWHKKRLRNPDRRYKYVRQVKGRAWQARAWLGDGRGSLNLGLFTVEACGEGLAERAAGLVAEAFDREWYGERTVGEVVEMLKRARKASERIPLGVTVPEHQRGLLKVETRREYKAAEAVARVARDNLFGESITPESVLEKWHREEERREEYFDDFAQGLEEGESVEDLVELLAG